MRASSPQTWRCRLKHALAFAWARTGALGLFRAAAPRLHGARVRVFGWHDIQHDPASLAARMMPPLAVSLRTFCAQLDHLQRAYHVVSLDDAVTLLEGERPMPRDKDVAVLTFDDGYAGVLEHGAPILAARGLPATLFVTTDVTSGRRPHPHDRLYALILRLRARGLRLLGSPVADRMQWPLARADLAVAEGDVIGATEALVLALPVSDMDRLGDALAARVGEPGPDQLPAVLDWGGATRCLELGIALGCHGRSHGHLPLAGDSTLADELATPRAEVAHRLGVLAHALAYPAGRYDARVAAAARAAGYRAAVTTEDRPNRRNDDLFRIGRKILTEEHARGAFGAPEPVVVAAQLDGLFAALGLAHAIPGDRGLDTPWL